MTNRLPSLNRLRAFEAAARHLSFSVVGRKIMARNFGVPRQIDRHTHTPVWRTWLVALLGVINAATFLHHRSG
jgi:hypothetical protein